ncbi:aldose epimerase family protein [Streptomyces sp. NPDC048161]|uniref:aldose epimerase family protein n=1 Tax=unclassified Streptomyces TaxID=2593676 RepID=UPI00081AF948|nr:MULTISPECIES: aldose epimerase family protein [unclassified Streptomyces]MYQ85525.1 galactose-1-epimerase [Streptomyces sp. SID4936]SCE06288.1 aldose 1-epimerase [Streptomyces sp. DvalAA-43]
MVTGSGTAIRTEDFGTLADGTPVHRWTLERDGTRVRVLTYGGIVQSVEVPDRDGARAGVALGLPDLAGYQAFPGPYFGALVGRYANRIGGARFELDGRTHRLTPNEGRNQVHGGARGFDKRVWRAREVAGGVELSLVSEDGEEGFPGRLAVSAAYTLDEGGALRITYRATTDAPTVLNLTNHTYWNLAGDGSGSALGQVLRIAAGRITPADAESLPTGAFLPVEGTRFDFREPVPVGAGYDHNFVLDGTGPAAELYDAASGRVLTVTTTEPGLQLYTADHFDGRPFGPCAGIALETQHFPDSPNRPEFPSTVLRPDEEFVSTTVYGFTVR